MVWWENFRFDDKLYTVYSYMNTFYVGFTRKNNLRVRMLRNSKKKMGKCTRQMAIKGQ